MPKIRQLNTLNNYNSLFRSMIKDQKRRHTDRTRNNLTRKTRKTYEELKRLEILKKVQNHHSRMASKKRGTKF